jgi:hypothetical protein
MGSIRTSNPPNMRMIESHSTSWRDLFPKTRVSWHPQTREEEETESQSELLYDWRFIANQFVLATNPLRPTARIFIFQLNTCGCSPYVTSSLTIGWVCRLQLLLVLASAVILRSESRGTHDHILLSQIRVSANREGKVTVFISPRIRAAQLYPQALGSLFITSYDLQSCGGGIQPHLRGRHCLPLTPLTLYSLAVSCREITSNRPPLIQTNM